MRIYFVETKTGGKVVFSAAVEMVYTTHLTGRITDNIRLAGIAITISDEIVLCPLRCISPKDQIYVTETELEKQGYAEQEYAIELTDIMTETLTLDDFATLNGEKVKRTPQSFQYVQRVYDCPVKMLEDMDNHILIPIHKKWADMIISGEKKYEFRNVLPKALKEIKICE